ncbi:MAG: phosphoribosylformylglycinamidine synthase subunit PurS [Bacteroidia bacterium]|nr:phosphoribosylformylglycinamidine synthase subunit PurS [Bacteroidia bacterium]MCX7652468.1 phosphoribosylformylglycinamidine synthase subunit PurS [Bacteroidia bacterium]MDW8416870.1 phosphoribosylformylglycinamidine synthase subunit PurS [Bacteroidia bacterium]
MPTYRVQVIVLPRPALLDPEGETITNAAHRLGYGQIQQIRAGRAFVLDIQTTSPEEALRLGEALADQLLHNPVVETYEVSLLSK